VNASMPEARRSWTQRDAALAQERADAAEEQLLQNEDFGGPEHVVWIPHGSRGAPITASGARMFAANVTVQVISDYSGSTFRDSSQSQSTIKDSGNSFEASANVPGTVNEHKVWDDVEEDQSGPNESCSDNEGEEVLEPPPSVGSRGHALGECRVCSFVSSKTGCRYGADCEFCHYKHTRTPKLSKKRRAHCEKFIRRQMEQLKANPDAVKEVERSLPPKVQARAHLKAKILAGLDTFADFVREEQDGQAVQLPRRRIIAL